MELTNFLEQVIKRGILFSLGHIFLIFTSLVIGLAAYRRNPSSLNNRSFLLLNIAGLLFAASMYAADFIFLPHRTLLYIIRISFVTGYFWAVTILFFCLTFPEARRQKPLYFKITALLYPLLALILLSDLVVKDIFVNKFATPALTASYGPFYPILFLITVYLVLAMVITLYRKTKKLKGKQKAQAQLVLFGLIALFAGLFITNLIPQLLGGIGLSRYGALNLFFFIGFTAYAVARYRFMDIRLLVLRSVAYFIFLALIVGIYVSFAVLVFQRLRFLIDPLILNIIVLFVLIISFNPLRNQIDKYTNKLFAMGRYDFDTLLTELINISRQNSRNTDKLTMNLMKTLAKQMHISETAFIFIKKPASLVVKSRGFNKKPKSFWQSLTKTALPLNKITTLEDFTDDSSEKELLSAAGIEVLIPIQTTEHKTTAVLFLGEKTSGDMYPTQDIKLLNLATPHISIALENAKYYTQEKVISVTLQNSLRGLEPPQEDIEIGVRYHSATEAALVGGDFYDFIKKDDNLHIMLGDISGKGVVTAIDAGMVRYAFRLLVWASQNGNPGDLLYKLNNFLQTQFKHGQFVSAIYAIYSKEGDLIILNAGHPQPLIFNTDNNWGYFLSGGSGSVLGVFPNEYYDLISLKFKKNDIVVLYTDGLIEAKRAKELYSELRLYDVVKANSSKSAQALADIIFKEVEIFTKGILTDDMAVIVLKSL